MARRDCTPLRHSLSRLFPARTIRRLAATSGAVRRQRRVDVVALFWVFVLSVGSRRRSIADLRRAYARVTGVRLAPSAFYGRLTESMTRLFKQAVEHGFRRVEETRKPSATWLGLRDVLCIDSTVVRLHDLLRRAFPACRTNHTLAAAKLHTVLNVLGRGPQRVRITAERVHDGPVLRAGPWVRDRLLLFDLGYWRFQLFDSIQHHGGYFLTRLKDSANPTIVKRLQTYRGGVDAVAGRGLQDVKHRLRREIFDAEAELEFRRRSYNGRRRRATMRVRVVGIRDEIHGGYHWYITNLPADRLAAEEIGKLYAVRWSIELLFRELKQRYHLEDIPSAKRHVVELFLYAAILTLLASRAVLAAIETRCVAARLPIERWARLFGSVAPTLLVILLDPLRMARLRERKMLPWLIAEAVDPNKSRSLLLDRAGLSCVA